MNFESVQSKLKNHTPSILGSDKFSRYAVMVPLIEKEDGIHVLFEVRSLQLRRQPGEICFPGGRIDPQDLDEKSAAIRETMEELGINRENLTEVYPLDFMISPFGMMIYPFAAMMKNPEEIQPNPAEVGEIFTVPLTYFMENNPDIYNIHFKVEPEENFPFDLIVGGENYNWRTRALDEYFYLYEEKAIWGLTAKILSHFIEIVKQ
ncbi:8-oxo-dGTP pyrophosphatase MutT (NUDIX family) [Bacillus niacini]|uniref:8-oxo-dGTP pyrophosphatase MutT (NUDIX family) n=1 Tax=Neobacillus niacini TaxID=86668 RepID=A0A852T9U2_9BACI|nr:CoA pyrophosphatase [Neobacillus niacini]NYE04547.1 8-oxo-dGTP pyrophosphatase MutT (NUDIX family) [Neobacillus niacini]